MNRMVGWKMLEACKGTKDIWGICTKFIVVKETVLMLKTGTPA